jgi:hypothetical protein
VLQPYVVILLFGLFNWLERLRGFEQVFAQVLPLALAAVLALKLGFAIWAGRKSLRRRLVTRAATLKYAATWLCLAVALILLVLVASDANWWRVSICLGILIALPLARMSFYPLVFQAARHR